MKHGKINTGYNYSDTKSQQNNILLRKTLTLINIFPISRAMTNSEKKHKLAILVNSNKIIV